MKKFLKNNINFFVFFLFSMILEIGTLFTLEHRFFIKQPWLSITIIGLIFSVYNLVKSQLVKNILLYTCYFFQAVICLFCVILYENTGTLFEFNMLNLAAQTAGLIGSIIVNYLYIFCLIALFTSFSLTISYTNKFSSKEHCRTKSNVIISSVCLFVFLISHISVTIATNSINHKKFINGLYEDSNDKYVNLGGTTNFINELYKMLFFNNYDEFSIEAVEEYMYSSTNTPTEYFGISKGNNLVTILVESFEWFAFVSDPSIYPNGTNLTAETLDTLYPNIRNFYNSSIVMTNNYTQDKTDLSENEALLGQYPSNNYINYDCIDNQFITSMANVIKSFHPEIETNFFHSNQKNFYNRHSNSKNLGYDNLYFIEDMIEYGVENYMVGDSLTSGKNMNLDSELIEKMKDKMFPADKQFLTHITSISMHGSYSAYRENMSQWYSKLNELDVTISNENLKNYMVSVMEFDYALGLMLNDLDAKGILDNTTIVLFSDHNAYMSNLTYSVKNISSTEYSNANYLELYRLPLMIYDSNIGNKTITKFTSIFDITPTILDLFGINYYTNFYYGTSVFSNQQSILYSRVYDIFITDKLYFSNIHNILFKDSSVSDTYIADIERKGLSLLEKIYYTNHLFYYNYFSNSKNYNTYINNMALINSQN